MSAVSTSARNFSRPSSLFRSSVTERLLRFHTMNGAPSPLTKGGMRRASSPPSGFSTLMTSAPMSASCMAQNGPDKWPLRSITRSPASAPAIAFLLGRFKCPPARRRLQTPHRRTAFLRRGIGLAPIALLHHEDDPMKALVHRLPAGAPQDVSALHAAIDAGTIRPESIVAVLGKTEGNGCVNDFTRGYATSALKSAIAARLGESPDLVEKRVAFVMSGGTEGGLSPHWIVFEVRDAPTPSTGTKALAIGVAFTPAFAPEEVGRRAQVEATADAVRRAMTSARITAPADVHYVQVKCPLLTKARIADAEARGKTVATHDTYVSMGYSRGASALGVAQALGELGGRVVGDAAVCRDLSLFSGV